MLLIAAVALVLLRFVGPGVINTALTPFREREQKRADLTDSVEQKRIQKAAVEHAQRQLADWRSRSLPPDPRATLKDKPDALNAHGKYQEWITKLTVLSGFENPKITPAGTRRLGGKTVYMALNVTVEADVTFGQLATFLDHFYRANLLHRITKLSVDCRESTGDPQMKAVIDCEALALLDVPSRPTLLPETTLAAELSEGDHTCRVTSQEGFPRKAPFRIRIGAEYLTVTALEGNHWTIDRAVERTRATDHAAGAAVEFTPLNPAFPSKTQEDFREVLAANVFIKPPPPKKYDLRVGPLGEMAFVRGKSFEFTIPVKDYDPTLGKPEFTVAGSTPPGLSIDRGNGRITWRPAADQPAGKFPLTVEVRHPSAKNGRVQDKLTIVFREPNAPPVINAGTPPVAFLGRPWTHKLDVADPETPLEMLKIRLADGAPEGLAVVDGELRWTAPETLAPGDFNVRVEITDDGTPSQSVSTTLALKLQDDDAQFTKLTGIVSKNQRWEAMLYNQLKDKATVVQVGDAIHVADVTGTVADIKPKFVLVKQGEQLMRLDLGENFRSLRPAPEG
jgi:hypothetical protein